jgi:hypothetical protein
MLASIPWEYTPMTENIEQATVPNYINQAQNWVKKYYPQYEEYFRPIFKELNEMWKNDNNTFNKKIHDNFEIFKEELTTEKDKITTILLTIDELIGEKTFIRWKKIIDSKEWEELLKWISNEIINDIKIQFSKELKESKEKLAKNKEKLSRIKGIREIINKNDTSPEIIIKSIEERFNYTDINDVKNDKTIQEIIKYYISFSKRINWKQSQLGKKYIEEYKRLQ